MVAFSANGVKCKSQANGLDNDGAFSSAEGAKWPPKNCRDFLSNHYSALSALSIFALD